MGWGRAVPKHYKTFHPFNSFVCGVLFRFSAVGPTYQMTLVKEGIEREYLPAKVLCHCLKKGCALSIVSVPSKEAGVNQASSSQHMRMLLTYEYSSYILKNSVKWGERAKACYPRWEQVVCRASVVYDLMQARNYIYYGWGRGHLEIPLIFCCRLICYQLLFCLCLCFSESVSVYVYIYLAIYR